MTTLSTRLQLLKPDDGGPGGDDTVDVTTQISNNYDKIDDAVGILDYTGSQPSTNNYVGRLARNTVTGWIYRYNGSAWELFYAKPFNIQALTGSNPASGSNLGVGNVWSGLINNSVGGNTIFTPGVDNITWNMPGRVTLDILYYIPGPGAADKMGGVNLPGAPAEQQTGNFRAFDRGTLNLNRIVAASDVWSFYQFQNSGGVVATTFNLHGTFQPL